MFGDKFNIGSIMKNAKKMQDMVEKAQEELAHTEVTGEAGAGAVKVIMTAKFVVKSLTIDDEILKESKEVLQELIIAAFNDATRKAEEAAKSKMSDASQLLGGIVGGSDDQDS